jgi:hypothetical protein
MAEPDFKFKVKQRVICPGGPGVIETAEASPQSSFRHYQVRCDSDKVLRRYTEGHIRPEVKKA